MPTHDPYFLSKGPHSSPADGRCAMEWVAHLAGEKHSDTPACVSPVLQRFGVTFNDRLGDEYRQKLRPYLARCISTAGDGRDEERIQIMREWLIHKRLPELLEECGRTTVAQKLRDLPVEALTPQVVDKAMVEARDEAYAARTEARAKPGAKVRARWPAAAATTTTTTTATDAAATDAAAYAAAYAATTDAAAYAAASQSTYNEVYKVCRKAANDALVPRAVQEGLELFDRLLPTEVVQLPVAKDADLVCALP